MKFTTPLAVLLLPALLWALPVGAFSNPFVEGSVEEIQQRSADEGKLYFLLFTADYVMTCKWMDEETFADPTLRSYLSESYLGLRVDINQPNGKALQQQYEVTQLPTVLVFSSRCQLLGRHVGTIPADELMAKMKTYDRPAFRQPIKAEIAETDVLPSPQPILSLSFPRLIPDVPPAIGVSNRVSEPQPAHRAYSGAHYTVQLGVFGAQPNAEAAQAQLQAHCGKNIRVVAGHSSGTPIYRLYTGIYYDKGQALQQQRQLQSAGIESFVKRIAR